MDKLKLAAVLKLKPVWYILNKYMMLNIVSKIKGVINWRGKFLKALKYIAVAAVIIAAFIIIKDEIVWQLSPENEEYSGQNYSGEAGDCNVAGIELYGTLLTYAMPSGGGEEGEFADGQSVSSDIVYFIKQAEDNPDIKAILLEIDSYGGSVIAGEEISRALKESLKPTAVLIREGGVSAAYFAATGGDRIFASKYSDIGSIAVTMSYLDNTEKNYKEGLFYNQLMSGKFKDAGSYDKKLSFEEKTLFMRDLDIMHKDLVREVAENRNLDIKKVEKLADGSSMLGKMALENGLIDQLGGIFETEKYLEEKIGEDAKICWQN